MVNETLSNENASVGYHLHIEGNEEAVDALAIKDGSNRVECRTNSIVDVYGLPRWIMEKIDVVWKKKVILTF